MSKVGYLVPTTCERNSSTTLALCYDLPSELQPSALQLERDRSASIKSLWRQPPHDLGYHTRHVLTRRVLPLPVPTSDMMKKVQKLDLAFGVSTNPNTDDGQLERGYWAYLAYARAWVRVMLVFWRTPTLSAPSLVSSQHDSLYRSALHI